MRIGLTGADGVLGQRITSEIQRFDDEVIPFTGDVRNADQVKAWAANCGRLVHAAAVVPTRDVDAARGEAISVNVGGSAHVAQAAREFGLHLTYVSTSHVYGAKTTALRETDAARPTSFYGLTKLQGEECIRFIARDPLIVRVFSFFDARQQPPFLVPTLRQRIIEAPIGGELALRGASHVRDIVDGAWTAGVIVALMRAEATGVVNCGSGQGRTVLEIAEAVAQAVGRDDIHWRPAEDDAESSLFADTAELSRRLGATPGFSLEAALRVAYPDTARAQGVGHG